MAITDFDSAAAVIIYRLQAMETLEYGAVQRDLFRRDQTALIRAAITMDNY